jgi:outer membrane murein-binding lipoprotein Lpp
MLTVEAKLAHWKKLYVNLGDAQARLGKAVDPTTRSLLEAEVDRLQRESDAALEAVHAALATAHKAGSGSNTQAFR